MVVINTGKRDLNEQPKRMYVKNNCFSIWYANAREQAWDDTGRGIFLTMNRVQFNGLSQTKEMLWTWHMKI